MHGQMDGRTDEQWTQRHDIGLWPMELKIMTGQPKSELCKVQATCVSKCDCRNNHDFKNGMELNKSQVLLSSLTLAFSSLIAFCSYLGMSKSIVQSPSHLFQRFK